MYPARAPREETSTVSRARRRTHRARMVSLFAFTVTFGLYYSSYSGVT